MSYGHNIGIILSFMLWAGSLRAGVTDIEKSDSLGLSCTSVSTEKIMVLKSLWSESSNAASLSCYDFGNRVAKAWMGYNHESGNYSLFQEPEELNRYGFYTNGYSRVGKWQFYGFFNYYNETSKGVRWVDVMEPYNGNPYSVGDSIGGDYWREYYNMEGKSTLMLTDHLSLGIDVKYKGGVGTKRKDPRPENTITNFEFSPGLIWQYGRLKLGTSFRMESGKEDIEFDAVNDRKYDLFYFRGLSAFSSTTEEDGRYSQTNLLGGGIQGNFSGHFLENFTSFQFNRQTTDIKRGSTYPLQMGLLDKYAIEVSALFLFNPKGKNISRLKLHYNDTRVYGQEPVVEPKLEEVSWQWSTAAKYTLYWQTSSDYGIGYSFFKVRDPNHFYWGGTISGKYSIDETTYYFVPEFNRQIINQLTLEASLEKSFLSGNNQLVIELNGGYRGSPSHSLEITNDEKLRKNIMLEFLQHDFDYRVANRWNTGVRINYGREIRFYKSSVQFFLEAGYQRSMTDFHGQASANIIQVSAGINF